MFAGGNVTADDEIEQTDHDVYFICSDLGSDELDYFYAAEPKTVTTTIEDGSGTVYYDVKNTISVNARVWSAINDGKNNIVRIYVSAVGHYEVIPRAYTPADNHFVGTHGLNIESVVASVDGTDTTQQNLQTTYSNSNNMTDGPEGGDEDDDLLRETAEFGIKYAAERKDKLGLISIAEFVWEQTEPRGGSTETIDGSIGEGGKVRHHWNAPFYQWDVNPPRARYYSGGTLLHLDTDSTPPDSVTLDISADNEIGVYDLTLDDFVEGYERLDGAETSFEIEIKNAEPTEVEELGTDADHYDAGEDSSVVSPIFKDLKVTNPAQCTDVTYEVEIELRAGWTDGFETLTYAWITHDEELNKQVNIYVPEGTVNEEVDIRYSVRTSDTYGGWELDPISRNSLFSVTNEETDDGGGGGGGGDAPVHPTGDGTG